MSRIVICEKGTQAENLRKALGSSHGKILAAQGHLLEMVEPAEVNPAWAGRFQPGLMWPGHFYPMKVKDATRAKYNAIRDALRDATEVVIATDLDREGQVIGDELLEMLGFKGKSYRAIFNAEDPKSLKEAFSKLVPNSEYFNLYQSGVARQQADKISNLSLTRTATAIMGSEALRGAIGVGRVKTPVLSIICRRELEILNFKSEDLFDVQANTKVESGTLVLGCNKIPATLLKEQAAQPEAELDTDLEALGEDGAALQEEESTSSRIKRRDIADGLAAAVTGYQGKIAAKQERKEQGPPKLFSLTSLQALTSKKFGWNGDKTLKVAQQLYSERGIITYPRGQNKYLPENELPNVPLMVKSLLAVSELSGLASVLTKPQPRLGTNGHFSDKDRAGDSHYAIVPNVNEADKFSSIMGELSADERKLFEVIARQYLAALAPDYEYLQTTIQMPFEWRGHIWDFRASGSVPITHGWKEILGKGGDGKVEEPDLPAVKNGEAGTVTNAVVRSTKTKPPTRHTDGSLLVLMEEAWRLVPPGPNREKLRATKGIGTPATRPGIIKGLFDQGQLELSGKSIKPTSGGMLIFKGLSETCPNVCDPRRTAMWEMLWDAVAQGKMSAMDAVKKVLIDTQSEIDLIVTNGKDANITIGKTQRPTMNMVNAADTIAKRKNIKPPVKYKTDAAVCRAFLQKHLPKREPGQEGAPSAPSEAQLNYANRIAEQIGKPLPDTATGNARELSKWIETNKPADNPPTEKQVGFARRLAEENDVALPKDVETSMSACSAFIKKYMGKSKSGGNSSGSSRKSK